MTPERFYTLVATDALTRGLPLDQELEQAAATVGQTSPELQAAIASAKEGKLGEALRSLSAVGLDPMVADAALLEPASTDEVSRRLRAFDDIPAMWQPIRAMLCYLAVVMAVLWLGGQLQAFALGRIPVDLSAASGFAGWLVSAGGRVAITTVPLVLLAALVAGLLRLRGERPELPWSWLWEPLEQARLYAAAAALARGKRGSTAMTWLSQKLPAAHERLASSGSATDPEGLELDELAEYHGARARERAIRALFWVKTGGTVAAVLIGLCVAGAVYLRLPLLAASGGPP